MITNRKIYKYRDYNFNMGIAKKKILRKAGILAPIVLAGLMSYTEHGCKAPSNYVKPQPVKMEKEIFPNLLGLEGINDSFAYNFLNKDRAHDSWQFNFQDIFLNSAIDKYFNKIKNPNSKTDEGLSNMIDNYKHSFENSADKYQIDADLAVAVALTESNGYHEKKQGKINKSEKGAKGIMQLTRRTAKSLKVNPHDVEQNINGGSKYLASLLKNYNGDLLTSLAAYNAGPGRVKEAMDLADSKDFLVFRPHLPEQAQEYPFKVLAYLKYIGKSYNPDSKKIYDNEEPSLEGTKYSQK